MKLLASLTSPYARKIRVVLAEKNLPFELVVDSPWEANTRVPTLNPLGKVPVLVADDGETFFDSPVIVGYLETLGVAPALLPDDPLARVRARQAEALADGITDAAVAALLESRRPDGERSAREIGRQHHKIERGLVELGARVSRQRGFDGAALQIGDVAAGCALGYLDLRFPTLDWRASHPVLAAYAARLLARPSFVDTTPPAG